MSQPESVDAPVDPGLLDLADRLGHTFERIDQLEQSLRHRSWCAENGGAASNERLEFLGDAVLQLAITRRLFELSPELPEGVLAQRRAALVNTRTLAGAARRMQLGDWLRLGRGEMSTGGADKDSILADATEAVIGAVYIDAGIDSASDVVSRLLAEEIERVEAGRDTGDPKSRLQEVAAHVLDEVPTYDVVGDGPDHERSFEARVELGDETWGTGEGRSKKEAEQAAAAAALERLHNEERVIE